MDKMAFSMYRSRPETAVILQETGRSVAESGVLMKAKPTRKDQGNFLYEDLIVQLNPKDPLLKLATSIPWERFEQEFSGLYSEHSRCKSTKRTFVSLWQKYARPG